MEVIEPISKMQKICESLRRNGKRIRFIPTMGALHAGHASLIEAARSEPLTEDESKKSKDEEDVTPGSSNNSGLHGSKANLEGTGGAQSPVIIVSLFANPLQFNVGSDFERYPKTIRKDLELCKSLSVHYVFLPSCDEMYPGLSYGAYDRDHRKKELVVDSRRGDRTPCYVVPPPDLNNDLEGKSREGHFRGVLTIVCKLFNIVRPHEAYFGEKDYQQMMIVKRMVLDLNMNVNIRPVATVSDPTDLLPLSSRNVRLSDEERKAAPFMCKILQDAKMALEALDIDTIYLKHVDEIIQASLVTTRALASRNEYELVHVDYLQLRCSKHFSKIVFHDYSLCHFDCEHACVRMQIRHEKGLILKTRLLISCIVGRHRDVGVRLLDNIEVRMNTNSHYNN